MKIFFVYFFTKKSIKLIFDVTLLFIFDFLVTIKMLQI